MFRCARRRPGAVLPVSAPALVALALLCAPGSAGAQGGAAANPRAAQPERPTVATHAYTVAPGLAELEIGVQRQQHGSTADRLAVPVLLKIGLAGRVQLDLAPAWQRDAEGGGVRSGLTDILVGIKWRVADEAPVIGAFAIQSTLSLPTGSPESGRGSGKAAVNVLLISSRRIGPLSLDVNAGYTRLGGESTTSPLNSTVWTAAAALPIAGRVGWAAELYGYPGTSGPHGQPPVVALLTGPTLTVRPRVVLDAGAIFDVARFGGTAVYAGLTWNLGRIWRSSGQPSRHPLPRAIR
jgi:hypothetical protein